MVLHCLIVLGMYLPNPEVFCQAVVRGDAGVSRPCRLGVPSRRSGQAYAEQTFRELAPDTVVAARPTGGHFGSQICKSVQERQHVLLRHGEKVGV